jgi:mono-ADP-ribosyltransferase sirtuin 6
MSAGYADRLKDYSNKGKCGLPENFDTARQFQTKIGQLVKLVRKSKKITILTGAGISTSAGIPDFRGPQGIWTLEAAHKGKKRKRESNNHTCMDFAKAKPTVTHKAITRLVTDKKVHFCVTQNVDGLHQRSGLSREYLAVLHGCAFTEKCEVCHTEFFCDEDVGGMSFQKTGRKCTQCKGDLRDTLLDWDDPLPEDDFERATEACNDSDMILCLGTSLRIEPAASLSIAAKVCVIVNLQETPYDGKASLVIRERVDKVISKLMLELGYPKRWDEEASPPIERAWRQPPRSDQDESVV